MFAIGRDRISIDIRERSQMHLESRLLRPKKQWPRKCADKPSFRSNHKETENHFRRICALEKCDQFSEENGVRLFVKIFRSVIVLIMNSLNLIKSHLRGLKRNSSRLPVNIAFVETDLFVDGRPQLTSYFGVRLRGLRTLEAIVHRVHNPLRKKDFVISW